MQHNTIRIQIEDHKPTNVIAIKQFEHSLIKLMSF